MSQKRQPVIECPKQTSAVTTLTYEFVHGHVIPAHFHHEDQLVYACRGVMTVRTGSGIWVVPPQRAVWIPARTPHGIRMSGAVSMRTLYLRPGMVRVLPRTCCVLNVPALLQELIIHVCTMGKLSRKSKSQAHLIEVLIDQLEIVRTVALQLPSPTDVRAARVAAMLRRNLGHASLQAVCRHAGASKRTIERIFLQETKLSVGKWRQQLRLLRSLELLAAGEKISYAALEAGYSTPSAFVAMFRKALGTTPRRYFENSLQANSTRASARSH